MKALAQLGGLGSGLTLRMEACSITISSLIERSLIAHGGVANTEGQAKKGIVLSAGKKYQTAQMPPGTYGHKAI